MPKIFLFESGTTGWSGSFKSCFYVASSLQSKGYSVIVGCLNESDYWPKLSSRNIPVIKFEHKFYSRKTRGRIFFSIIKHVDGQTKKLFPSFPFSLERWINFQFISKLRKVLRENNIDLVHTNTSLFRDMEILREVSNLSLPIVCHLRGDPYRQLTLEEKKLVNYSRVCFIAISIAIKQKWIRAGLPEEKIELIYNAQPKLEKKEFKNKEKNKESLSDTHSVRLLFIGRLEKVKGVDVLIEALKNIDKKLWTLSIVGDGAEKVSFENLAKGHGILDNITFYGYQEQVNIFYPNHDIVIVPSLKEPFGRVVIEAMQFAIPVIASNIDGPAEIIENGKDGILFEVGSASALRNAINCLINNPQKRFKIGLSGQEKQKQFSEEIFMEKLLKIYDYMLKSV